MTDIVMISGKMGSGKTTLANSILSNASILEYDFYGTIKFAGTLYEMHNFILNKIKSYSNQYGLHLLKENCPVVLHDYILNRFEALGISGPKEDQEILEFFKQYVDNKIATNTTDLTDKDGPLLQYLGTEIGRNKFGENVWVDIVKNQVQKLHSNSLRRLIIIDDCRFENEFNAFPESLRVRLYCSENIRKDRAESWRDKTDHPSETGLDDYSARGLFDISFNTEIQSTHHCRDIIFAQLQKQVWKEKRAQ